MIFFFVFKFKLIFFIHQIYFQHVLAVKKKGAGKKTKQHLMGSFR